MMKGVVAPNGTVEVLTAGLWEEAREEARSLGLRGDERRAFVKAARVRFRAEHAHIIEVYGFIFGAHPEKVVMFNRQYGVLGLIPFDRAVGLINQAAITSRQGDYSVSGYRGDAVWVAHPESTDGRRSLQDTST